MHHFRQLDPGGPFLFKLKHPINKVVGIGFFSSSSILPIDFAWEVFGKRNGFDEFKDFYLRIKDYRDKNKNSSNSIEKNHNIGCIVLTNPVFFNEEDWINPPNDWSGNIVQGKHYNTSTEVGKEYWDKIESILDKTEIYTSSNSAELNERYKTIISKVRIGQGAFRVLVTDAYSRRCAISGERTLPVLEAAHIKPYSIGGINETKNGLLLRSDIHKLFDTGYITINSVNYKIEVSSKIKEEFENGRDYYKFHGNQLVSIPGKIDEKPDKNFLLWHNEYRYEKKSLLFEV